MLRRKENYLPDLLTVGSLALNRSTYELSWQGKSQSLSGREFQILEMLMERPGFVVTTNQLLSHVWGWDSDVDCSVVWVHISNIRKKLARLGAPAGGDKKAPGSFRGQALRETGFSFRNGAPSSSGG